MGTLPTRHLRLVRGFKTDVPPRSALEQRAFDDFTTGTCCPAVTGRGCCPCCFARWLRARLMEHWWGEEFWQELDRDDFGILARPFHTNEALVADIALLLMTGNENLMILTWALETAQPVDEVIEILTVLDINDRRLPRFAWMGRRSNKIARTTTTTTITVAGTTAAPTTVTKRGPLPSAS